MWLKRKLEMKNYHELDSLLDEMLQNIGNTNPYIRDRLIYNAFAELIQDNYFTDAQTMYLFHHLISNEYLTNNLGQKENDSVYIRSFSALALAEILYKDQEDRILTKDQFNLALEKAIVYFTNENDKRGYTADKGWAHSVAHGSDLINVIITHPLFEESYFELVINSLLILVNTPFVYEDDEIERLSVPITNLITRYMNNPLFFIKIDEIINISTNKKSYTHLDTRIITNVRTLLRALYFRVDNEEYKCELLKRLKKLTL